MLAVYDSNGGILVKRDLSAGIGDAPVWIDMVEPTRNEDELVEAALGIVIPTREEMQEIEVSSRVYSQGGAHYMTATILLREDLPAVPEAQHAAGRTAEGLPPIPTPTPVTFVLAKDCLVTVRYKEPRAFSLFMSRNQRGDQPCMSAAGLLVCLLEAVIDREADRLEHLQTDVDRLGHRIFEIREPNGKADEVRNRNQMFDRAVREIGREGELSMRSRESLNSLERILTYLSLVLSDRHEDKALRQRVKSASRDVAGLNDQLNYLSNRIQFLLDATLGMIGLEQSRTIKFFTVVSVALMPPTLLASNWGMNFKHMPELSWEIGYPLALVMMIASAIIPFWYFRRKGWL